MLLATVGSVCVLETENEMSLQNLVNKSLGVKPMGFAALLASMKPATEAVAKKAGAIEPATREVVEAEIPELTTGFLPASMTNEEIAKAKADGKTRLGKVNSHGEYAIIRWDASDATWIVNRAGVRVTAAMAAYLLQQYKGHNRPITKPRMDRLADQQAKGGWHYVGNTAGFVVKTAGDVNANGQCNAGHSMTAQGKSGKTVVYDFYLGVPEQFANLADVNMQRAPKDVIARLHRFDRYKGMTEIDGVPIGVTLTEADTKTMDNLQSQALRVVACVIANKKSVKDSEPLGPNDIAVLDQKYGDVLQQAVLRTYLFDRSAQRLNDKMKSVAGALKHYVALSHCAAVMTLLATIETDGKYTLEADATNFVGMFFAALVDETNNDESNPAVVLRRTLVKWKISQSKKGSSQNIKWNALKMAIAAATVIGTEEQVDADDLSNALAGCEDTSKVYFDTVLDQAPPEKEAIEGTEVAELDTDDELEELPVDA